MKRNYYQQIFNICTLFLILIFLCSVVSILSSISMNTLQSITYLAFLYQFVSMLYITNLLIAFVSLFLFSTLIYYEVFLRLKEDNLTNLRKSIYQTFSMRMFLRQSEHSETVTTIEQVKVTRYNPINKYFNRAVRKAIVDIRENKIMLLIRIPKTQQATKILKDMEMLISEEISNRNPDYYFSRPERKGKWLYFIGTKRK
ncbi:membrane protein [Streptococcus pyogenes]|nr:membrane protein [Streptococcus pyogenes]